MKAPEDRGRNPRDELPIDETQRLIASDKVEGTEVYSPEGEQLGAIRNFMVDKVTGKVAYAVMSFGGLLGIGDRYHALPWRTLTYDTRLGGYVVTMSREKLERAPSYKAAETPWSEPDYGRSLHDYYGVPWGS